MKVISVTDPDGNIAYMEIDDEAIRLVNPPALPGGGTGAGIEEKATSFVYELQKVSKVIAQVCSSVQDTFLQSLKAVAPKELSLEFGVKLAGEAGIPLITKGTVEGTFKVTAKWTFG